MFALSPFAFPSISVPTGVSDMELIFSTTLTSAANSVTTGTLLTGFKSYLKNIRARSDRDNRSISFARVFFNNDTTESNYQNVSIKGENDPALEAEGQDLPPRIIVPTANSENHFLSGATMTVYRPESTSGYKSWYANLGSHTSSSNSNSGARRVYTVSGVWRNTAPITVLTFKMIGTMADGSDSDWEAGSSFEVYGLK